MRHLWAYLGALVREWVVFVAGGLFLADVRIYQESGHVVEPAWYLGAFATVYVVANYRVWAKERLRATGDQTAEPPVPAPPQGLARALAYVGRLVLCGGIGASTLVVGVGSAAGTLYLWFMAGVPPWAQAREWGLAAPHAAASRVAVVGITLGLATLWVLAVRRALQSRRQAH